MTLRSIAALLALAIAVPAGAQTLPEAAEMKAEPAGPWKVVKNAWNCVMERPLSVAGTPGVFTVTLEPLTKTSWLRVGIEGDGGSRDDGRAVMVIDGKQVPEDLHFNIYGMAPYRVREYMLDLEKHRLDTVKESLRFWTRRDGDIDVTLDRFPAAWAAAQTCLDGRYSEWGVDKASFERIAVAPEGSIFPAIKPGGAMEFALLYWVNEKGRVDDCRLLLPSGKAKFDETVCNKLKAKARLKPARDGQGNAIRVPQFDHPVIRTAILPMGQRPGN